MKKAPKLAGALRTERIVGRARELAAIKDAIQAEGELRIFYIIGEGGIGKTRLLEAIPKVIREAEKKGNPCRFAGPFDFYHSSLQTSSGLEMAIMKALDPKGQRFQAYRVARRKFEKARAAGSDPREIERRRHEAEQCFIQGFNEITAHSRVILTLDTMEVIQYESDVVQRICQIGMTGLEVKHWLLTNIPALQNAVIILAGRETPQLLADVRQHFGARLTELPLGPFSETETLDYFAAIAEMIPAFQQMGLSSDQQRVIHHYTGGLPMKVAFVIELLIRNLTLPQDFFDSWEKAQQKDPDELKDIQQRVEAELVAGIMTASDDIARALPYVALARKGINRELLCRLTKWTQAKATKVLSDLRHFSFVKARPGTDWLFLHDEMYDLMDRHAWNRMELEREHVCQVILDYYRERIAQARDPLQRQDLLVEQLYYQFLADPGKGYAQYAQLSDAALFDHDVGFDMRLRDEMLRFCTRYQDRVKWYGLTKGFIDYDAAVHWVKRHMYTGKYDDAIEVAEAVKARPHLYQGDVPGFRLARAELDVWHGLALIYTGKVGLAVTMLKTVLVDLEGLLEPEVLAHQDAPDSWRRNLILGWAHNNLGYAYWMELGHYRAALREFRSALPYFLASNLEEEIANTSDNMGRVYTLLGNRTRAELLIRDGLELRRRLGREFRIGLSLNSQAILHLSFGDPHRARRMNEQALRIFERLGAHRGIGLACTKLGVSLRQMGALWKTGVYRPEECDRFLNDAVVSLKRAIDIFTKTVDEPVRLVEAYNELGCAYRERVALLRSQDPESPPVREEEEKAVHYLTEAIRRTEGKNPVLYVDSCEDLAQVYFQCRDFDNTEVWLKRAAEAIPNVYKIERGLGLRDIPMEECIEEFWRQMGKIEMLHGHLTFDCGLGDDSKVPRPVLVEAMHHYVLAAAYFEHYSGRATGLQTVFGQLYDNFRRCEHNDLRYAQSQVLSIAEAYHLDASHLSRFFEDTLGLALQVTK